MWTEHEAREVAARHDRATAEGVFARQGNLFDGWEWWRRSDRTVWHQLGGAVVYKIENSPYGCANEDEHRHMREWVRFSWASDTELFRFTQPPVLAMPYYPGEITSNEDIPADINQVRVNDLHIENFRKTTDGRVKLIDAGYP